MNDRYTDAVVVLVSGPDAESLECLAAEIVADGLAACVSLIPRVRSVYRWEGAVRREDEALAVIKSTRGGVERLRDRIERIHAYDVPEFLVLPVEAGGAAYLDWIRDSVTAPEYESNDGQT